MNDSLPILEVVCGIIRDEEHKILLVRRAPGQKLAGYWEFPGGKVENETKECALIRELKEELSVTTEIEEYFMSNCYVSEHHELILHAYFVNIKFGNISLKVHDALVWHHSGLDIKLNLAPADVPIANKLGVF